MLLLCEFQGTTCVCNSCGHRDLLLSISFEGSFRHFEECLLYAQALDGTRLVEHHIVVILGPCLTLGDWDLPVSLLIELVANTDEWEGLWVAWSGVLVETISPSTKRVETLSIGNVIHEGAAVSSTIEGVAE